MSGVLCLVSLALFCLLISGCATTRQRAAATAEPVETVNEQIDAAQKVVGAMSNREMTREDLQVVAQDIRKNPESRSAVQKILGVSDDRPVVKYSPVTGKHYSGDLEFDPETGVKLEVVEE